MANGTSEKKRDIAMCYWLDLLTNVKVDVDDIKIVVNYDFPMVFEDYIHRIGRTGRSGKTGTSYTFLNRKNGKSLAQLVKVMEEANQVVPDNVYDLGHIRRDQRRQTNYQGAAPQQRGGYYAPPSAPRNQSNYGQNQSNYGQNKSNYGQNQSNYGQNNPTAPNTYKQYGFSGMGNQTQYYN